ncbi:hypothetical protein JANET_188 [Bacillus phage Janet]|nr:hypothetical protein JANET_188 [Bacillus phage Janet]
MGRKLEQEEQRTLNGNRFLKNVEATTGVLSRDTDQLFHQYKNLRVAVYNEFKGYISDEATRKELWSYISEHFVRLVKEYHINGEVDFPYYIKNKLKLRVKNSFIKNNYRDKNRVFVTRKDVDVANLIEEEEAHDIELDYYEVLEYVLYGVHLDEIDRDILYLLISEQKDNYIEKILYSRYAKEGVAALTIQEKIADLKELLRTRLHESLERRNR